MYNKALIYSKLSIHANRSNRKLKLKYVFTIFQFRCGSIEQVLLTFPSPVSLKNFQSTFYF